MSFTNSLKKIPIFNTSFMNHYFFIRTTANLKDVYKMPNPVCVIKCVTRANLEAFAKLTGDTNSVHFLGIDKNVPIVHGALLNGFVSGVIGTQCPGHGSIVVSQSFCFPNKCYIDKPIKINVEVIDVRKIIKVKYWCEQDGKIVFEGDARVIMNKKC